MPYPPPPPPTLASRGLHWQAATEPLRLGVRLGLWEAFHHCRRWNCSDIDSFRIANLTQTRSALAVAGGVHFDCQAPGPGSQRLRESVQPEVQCSRLSLTLSHRRRRRSGGHKLVTWQLVATGILSLRLSPTESDNQVANFAK